MYITFGFVIFEMNLLANIFFFLNQSKNYFRNLLENGLKVVKPILYFNLLNDPLSIDDSYCAGFGGV